MTVLDATNKLWEWFEHNDSFMLERDFTLLNLVETEKDAEDLLASESDLKPTFMLALEGLEKGEWIACKELDDKKYYILQRSFDSMQQQVEVGYYTAKYLAVEINTFCELIGDKKDYCKMSAVGEMDVRNLVHIIQYYKQKLTEAIVPTMGAGGDDDFNIDSSQKPKRKK